MAVSRFNFSGFFTASRAPIRPSSIAIEATSPEIKTASRLDPSEMSVKLFKIGTVLMRSPTPSLDILLPK